jgi:hypothetical protein
MCDSLAENVDVATQILDDIVRGSVIKPSSDKLGSLLRFVIARKWNSWYPCYFDTLGGCYAFITRDSEKDPSKNAGVILIDPGIKFSDNLRDMHNIEPYDIRKVVVSHYHPDHTMGLYELLTLTHESHYPCSYYLNKTSYDSFKSFQGKYNKIIELARDQVVRLAEYDYSPSSNSRKGYYSKNINIHDLIYMKSIKTFHSEVGNRNNCLGFSFNISSSKNKKFHSKHEITLLGDTDGNDAYLSKYLEYIKQSDIAILHLGSYSEKDFGEGNKHLYKMGMINILNCISCRKKGLMPRREGRIVECIENGIIKEVNGKITYEGHNKCHIHESDYFRNLKLVVVSEIGLEMAPIEEMMKSFDYFKWLTNLYPILLMFKFSKLYEDDYAKRLGGRSQGLKIFRNILSTKGADSIVTLIDKKLKDDEIIEIYNFCIFSSFILFCVSMVQVSESEWIELFLPKIANEKLKECLNHPSQFGCSDLETIKKMIAQKEKEAKYRINVATNNEKAKMIFKGLKEINCDEYSNEGYDYDIFLANFELKAANSNALGFIRNFEANASKFLDMFLESVLLRGISQEELGDKIGVFSEKMFYSIRDSYKFDSNKIADNFQSYYSFASRFSLFDNFSDILNFLRGRFELNRCDLDALVYLFIYVVNKRAIERNIVNNKAEYQNENLNDGGDEKKEYEQDSLIQLLLEIFREYESSDLKVFLADLGMEIDLSCKILKIKCAQGPWISLDSAVQRIIDGKLKIISE